MNVAHALWLSIALTACANSNARQAADQSRARVETTSASHSPARLGPPSPRGLGFRRVDRPSPTQPPLALY